MSVMGRLIVEAIIIVGLPVFAFFGGGWLMSEVCNRAYVRQRLADQAPVADRKPLNMRPLGYDRGAVERHWSALDKKALPLEKCFLEWDLLFPVLYGAAFAFSLLLTWELLGRPFHPAWLVVPVVITVAADWVENSVQLNQLKHYMTGGAASLQADLIRVAGVATTIKILFFSGVSLLLLSLVVWLLFRASKIVT